MIRKTVIITGGGRGIGEGISIKFAEANYNVVINYSRSESAALATADKCRNYGIEALTVKADVSSKEDCKKLVDASLDKFGKIDVLVNNAGIDGKLYPIWDCPEDEFLKVMDLNVNSQFYMTKYASENMIKNSNGGSIINIASMLADLGAPNMSGYVTSKAASVGLTKTSALDLAEYNINVNAVGPGAIETDMIRELPKEIREGLISKIPMNRLGQPEEIGALCVYLASDGGRYITGKFIKIDGYYQS